MIQEYPTRNLIVNNVDYGSDWYEDICYDEFVHKNGFRITRNALYTHAAREYEQHLRHSRDIYPGARVTGNLNQLAQMAGYQQDVYGNLIGPQGYATAPPWSTAYVPPPVAPPVVIPKSNVKNKKLLLTRKRK